LLERIRGVGADNPQCLRTSFRSRMICLRSCDVTQSGGEDIDIAQSGSNDVESAGAGAGSQA
jgi:hypothetical protein